MPNCANCGTRWGAEYTWNSTITRMDLNNQKICYKCYCKLQQQEIAKSTITVDDFPSLRDVMAKGRVAMTCCNCPECNNKLDLPWAGNLLICKYCGFPITPMNIFEKVKPLIP